MPQAVPAVFGATVQRLATDLAPVFGQQTVALDLLHYDDRPYSHVVRLAVRTPDSPLVLSRVFVKKLKIKADAGEARMRERVVHEFTTTQRVYDAMAGAAEMGTIRPLVHYPDALTIVTEEVAGQTLLEHLQQRAVWFPSADAVAQLERTLAATGRWIAGLQTVDARSGQVSADDLRAYIDLRLGKLVAAPRLGFDESRRQAVLRHIDCLAGALTPDDLGEVLVHADLALGNVIIDGARIVVLDFAMAHRGTRLQDITRLHTQLDLLCAKPQFRRAVVTRLQHALRVGFDPTLTEAAPLFRLFTLLHRINNLATVALRPSPFPASLYDAHVRRLHERWLTRELRTPVETATAS